MSAVFPLHISRRVHNPHVSRFPLHISRRGHDPHVSRFFLSIFHGGDTIPMSAVFLSISHSGDTIPISAVFPLHISRRGHNPYPQPSSLLISRRGTNPHFGRPLLTFAYLKSEAQSLFQPKTPISHGNSADPYTYQGGAKKFLLPLNRLGFSQGRRPLRKPPPQ
jgi:hypothetical protein